MAAGARDQGAAAASPGGVSAGAEPAADDAVITMGAAEPGDAGVASSAGGTAAPPPPGKQQGPRRPRMYYVDWLRVVLTVAVLVHHTFNSYVGNEYYWFAKHKGYDPFLDALQNCTSVGMAYAMCLFFLLAGFFTPGSYNRKGPWKHLLDRCIRLLIPVVVFSMLIAPLTMAVNWAAGIVPENPSPFAAFRHIPSFGGVWYYYFRDMWNMAPGPTWFVWFLWWLDFGYVCCRLIAAAWMRRKSRRAQAAAAATSRGQDAPAPAGHLPIAATPAAPSGGRAVTGAKPSASAPSEEEFPMAKVLWWGAALIVVFTLLGFGSTMATWGSPYVHSYGGFATVARFFVFKPSWFGPNTISFIIGTQARQLNLLQRLPKRLAVWCLVSAGIWWAEAMLMVATLARPKAPAPANWGVTDMPIGYIFWAEFAMWSFSVVWGIGLLVLFREAFNSAPKRIGKLAIVGAYGAYIIHPLIIALFGWLLVPVPFTTAAGAAIAASPLVVLGSWAATLLVRLVPGAQRVLG